jgi:HEAT repeat protein
MAQVVRTMAWGVAVVAVAALRLGAVQAAQAPPLDERTAVAAAWPALDDSEADDPAEDEDETPAARAEELYEDGTDALDDEHWDDAIRKFDEVVRLGGERVDGALYWKAYALGKSARRAEAQAVIAQLRRQAPQSRWLKQADALEIELRQSSGERVSPEATQDDDLKLIALNALLSADSGKAIPMLERFLDSSSSRRLRDRALFVLTQSDDPQAQAILIDVARGRRNPDLQRGALRYLGMADSPQSRQALAEIYASSTDVAIKKAVLHAYLVAGDTEHVLAAARGETSPELRRAAIQQLGAMGAQAELWEMYRAEPSRDLKKSILHAMFISGDARLVDLARTEKDPELRRVAVRNLGMLDDKRTGEALVSLYRNDPDASIRREAVQGLFIQGNAAALVQLARAEKDPALRKELVSKLALMNSKEAVDYMMELLK